MYAHSFFCILKKFIHSKCFFHFIKSRTENIFIKIKNNCFCFQARNSVIKNFVVHPKMRQVTPNKNHISLIKWLNIIANNSFAKTFKNVNQLHLRMKMKRRFKKNVISFNQRQKAVNTWTYFCLKNFHNNFSDDKDNIMQEKDNIAIGIFFSII